MNLALPAAQPTSAVYKAATETLYGIQFLRFLAASMVVVRHAAGRTDVAFPHQGFSDWFLGSAGVDIFFVVSGFLMVRVTEGRNADPLRFWLRRLIRIVPLYWACTLLTVLLLCLFPRYFFAIPILRM